MAFKSHTNFPKKERKNKKRRWQKDTKGKEKVRKGKETIRKIVILLKCKC